MGVARKGDAVGVVRQDARRRPVVARGIRIRRGAGAARVLVLAVEERARRVEFGPVRGEPRRQRVRVVGEAVRQGQCPPLVPDNRHPVAQDEGVALDRLDHDGRVVLVEKLAPKFLAVEIEAKLSRLLGRLDGPLSAAVAEAVHVVVAREEQPLDVRAVGAAVVREDLEPDPRDVGELVVVAVGREVARDEHRVDLAVAVELQRAAPDLGGVVALDVDVREDPDAQVGPRGGECGQARRSGRARGADHKVSSRQQNGGIVE